MEYEALWNERDFETLTKFVPSFLPEVTRRHGNGGQIGLPPGTILRIARNDYGEGNKQINLRWGLGCAKWDNCFTCPYDRCVYNDRSGDLPHDILPHPYYQGGEL